MGGYIYAIPFASAIVYNIALLALTTFLLTQFTVFKYFEPGELKGHYNLIALTVNLHKILACVCLCVMFFFEQHHKFSEFLIVSHCIPIFYHYYTKMDELLLKFRIKNNFVQQMQTAFMVMSPECLHKISNIGVIMSFYLMGRTDQTYYVFLTMFIWAIISLHNILLVFSSAKTKIKVNLDYDSDYYNSRHIPVTTVEFLKLILVPLIFFTITVDVVSLYNNFRIDWRVWMMYMLSMTVNVWLKILGLFDYYDSSKSAFERIKKKYFYKLG